MQLYTASRTSPYISLATFLNCWKITMRSSRKLQNVANAFGSVKFETSFLSFRGENYLISHFGPRKVQDFCRQRDRVHKPLAGATTGTTNSNTVAEAVVVVFTLVLCGIDRMNHKRAAEVLYWWCSTVSGCGAGHTWDFTCNALDEQGMLRGLAPSHPYICISTLSPVIICSFH